MSKVELRRSVHLPYVGVEPIDGNRKVCDTWPVHCQTYGHLTRLRVSALDWYQVILRGDRGTQV